MRRVTAFITPLALLIVASVGSSLPAGASTEAPVWGWGYYSGDGSSGISRVAPVPASLPADIVAIAAGQTMLAKEAGGAVWTWGANLGDGSTAYTNVPAHVPGLDGVTAMDSGLDHDLAVRPDGSVVAWGNNTYGQLGDGTTTFSATPLSVSGLGNAIAVAAGQVHSLALAADGTVWAWGRNHDGELGDATTKDRHKPVQVPALSGVVGIAAGTAGAHGWSLALKSDGTVWAWGYNHDGELGTGTFTGSLVPVQVTGLAGVTQIDAGSDFSLALKSDGTVWGWGLNNEGQLGTGLTPKVTSLPVQTRNVSGVSEISTSNQQSAALESDGTVWGWGYQSNGQLGVCSEVTVRKPMEMAGISGASAIAVGTAGAMAIRQGGPFPDVSSFSPVAAKVGRKVVFTGSGFTGTTSVAFNGTPAAFTVVSDTRLTSNMPDGALTGCVTITNTAGPTQSQTLLVKPQVTGFTPASGSPGTQVTISGSALTGATEVIFGGTAAPGFVVTDYDTISVLVPAGAKTGRIKMTTPGGTATSPTEFTVS